MRYYNLNRLLKTFNMRINRALLKWGYSNFSLSILEYCDKEDLIKREQYYMDTLNPEYNICTTAGSTLGKLHSEGTKAKLREAGIGRIHSEETKAKMAEAGIGRKHTEETKTKISDAQTGYKHPDEIKKRISEAKKGKPKIEGSGRPAQSIEVFDNKNNSTTIYDSIRAAARALDIKQSRISTYFARNQQKPYKGRYIFRDTESKL